MNTKPFAEYAFIICLLVFCTCSNAQTLITPDVVVPELTHQFIEPQPMIDPGLVRDVWEPAVNGDSFTADLTHYDAVEFRLSAGPQRKFMVDVPNDVCDVSLAIDIMYRNLGTGDMGTFPDRQRVTLENIWGGPAVQDYLLVYVGQEGNVIKAQAGFTIQGDMTFTGAHFLCE